MSSASSRLRLILDAEQAAAHALARLANAATDGDVRAYLEGLDRTIVWLRDGLAKRIRRGARRPSKRAVTFAALTDQLMSAPSTVDRLRLLNRHQRSVLAAIDQLLLEPLDDDLRALLQEGHALLNGSVGRGDDTIAALDRQREIPREPGTSAPSDRS